MLSRWVARPSSTFIIFFGSLTHYWFVTLQECLQFTRGRTSSSSSSSSSHRRRIALTTRRAFALTKLRVKLLKLLLLCQT
jgi:hypothetical protein